MNDLINEQARILASARALLAQVREAIAPLRAAWEAEYGDLLRQERTAAAIVKGADESLRAMAEANWLATKDANPAMGVTIKQTTVIRYDPKVAREWAMEFAQHLLSLDPRALEGWAKAASPAALPGWLTVEKVPAASVATDLQKAGQVVDFDLVASALLAQVGEAPATEAVDDAELPF